MHVIYHQSYIPHHGFLPYLHRKWNVMASFNCGTMQMFPDCVLIVCWISTYCPHPTLNLTFSHQLNSLFVSYSFLGIITTRYCQQVPHDHLAKACRFFCFLFWFGVAYQTSQWFTPLPAVWFTTCCQPAHPRWTGHTTYSSSNMVLWEYTCLFFSTCDSSDEHTGTSFGRYDAKFVTSWAWEWELLDKQWDGCCCYVTCFIEQSDVGKIFFSFLFFLYQ